MSIATQGVDSNDATRLRNLLGVLPHEEWELDRARKVQFSLRFLARLRRERPSLVVLEGTGLAAGAPLVLASLLFNTRYVVSSGDAVAPYMRLKAGLLGGLLGAIYERVLYRASAGVIGWTPYVVGRALTFGAPRGMTAEGWAPWPAGRVARDEVRRELAIPEGAVVYGIAGSLTWNASREYVYGLELVRAVTATTNANVYVVIVGDGDGRATLEAEAGSLLGGRVRFTGRVGQHEVSKYLAAFDYGSLPQSRDTVGMFRYTTKLSEYIAADLPIISTRVPASYDVMPEATTRVSAGSPWGRDYAVELASHMDAATSEIAAGDRRRCAVADSRGFDRDVQVARVSAFLSEMLGESTQQ